MFRPMVLLCLVSMAATAAFGQSPSPKDIDIAAPDGVKLRATLFPAAKPGPGVLLLHMCNTTRKSWGPVAKGLSEAGINALTVDNRGFGESGGPRFEGASEEVTKQLRQKWPGDFDAAFEYLMAQAGVDKSHMGAGGGSCGVNNAIQLAERHREVKTLVLLAGGTDLEGINFIFHHPELPIFTAAAADDEYNPATIDLMRWFSEISGNPRTKFEGFPNGGHGTEIFEPHPELVGDVVRFFAQTLNPPQREVSHPRKTPAREFWALANQADGAAQAAQMFREARKRDPKAVLFFEFPVNLLAYSRLQAGDKKDALELFKLNADAYPKSANAQDSLSDGYLAEGENELALKAEEECLKLLPGDPSDAEFKAALKKQADAKIAKLKAGK